ncbi:MAG: tRNA (N6-isopentenyl adenosine(37)-C2)-methylthiotransferase MiaB [Candidatus Marinimicrobia bacterium]|nr:tRNA (N6-isopentenyl adenosine(37)-C2)-methylthiotransferase MiaB [Candidatus Neomarinimicrobiota bacterium]MCF7850167.1 tRNA (N6-isopentenyl adenosine(37)-C2)-methylthiotransferase MiaB [Candidatus Neomarinimicrobiota bacterium]MCF7905150.1 tRNA (N6-isopentenyl adenosine(37)-C2)-methylthiotransferase MiaB [Candidatus Neomarinimicrobiota bacterium]
MQVRDEKINTPKKYYIETYGCQMNEYDSELVAGLLEKQNYIRTESSEDAQLILLNTCSVREHAEEKVHARLGNLKILKEKDPEVKLGLLGCMAQNLKEDILKSKPYVDVILGPDSYRKLPGMLEADEANELNVIDTKLSRMEVYDDLFPARREGINAWISIMRGCDKFCTFCIVPFTRGRERSRSIESIVEEVIQVSAEGFKEVTLLGQNVNSFHHEGRRFHELLDKVSEVDGIERIRYTSPHPQDFDDELIAVHATNPKVCNHIHFPLQAGSDTILERMNRTYTKAHFISLAEKMRDQIPGLAISTDMIVGFPGETEADFQETLDVMNTVKFDTAFTFKYSSRPGTKAAEFDDSVPEGEKQDRLERMIKLQREHTLLRNESHVGETLEVLVEKDSKKSEKQHQGRTRSNKIVIFDKTGEQPGDVVNVKVLDAKGITLFGRILN